MKARPVRVLLVDDHPVVRSGLRALLSTVEGVQVVAEAGTAAEAARVIAANPVDVAVVDLGLPDRSGVELTRSITARSGDTAVVVLTMNAEGRAVRDALDAGARGYVLKGTDHDELVRAILSVATGSAVLGPGVAQHLAARAGERPFPQLSNRELEVLRLLAQNLDNSAIARHLQVAPKTVRNYISTILVKIAASDRTAAILAAREAGLGQ
ncbi:MAG TPA: response regulator transcription factor [Euzebya sp.]|nr:response regulator transcription factor [Euzebya sp.]